MALILMIIGTVAWFWKGYIEVGLCLMIWAIWFENIAGSTAILSRLIPPNPDVIKKVKNILKGEERNN